MPKSSLEPSIWELIGQLGDALEDLGDEDSRKSRRNRIDKCLAKFANMVGQMMDKPGDK